MRCCHYPDDIFPALLGILPLVVAILLHGRCNLNLHFPQLCGLLLCQAEVSGSECCRALLWLQFTHLILGLCLGRNCKEIEHMPRIVLTTRVDWILQ